MAQSAKKYTVTVGIPAYNEEKNIGRILRSVLSQKSDSYLLEKIIVMADGCTDGTEEEVKKAADEYPIITLFSDKKRKGKAERLNRLYRLNTSDIIMTFDADVSLKDAGVMETMVGYFKDENVVAAGGNGQPLPGRTFMEKIAVASENLWYEARKDYKNGNNIYNSAGCAFALRKSFIKEKYFPEGITAEQQFIYLWATQGGKKFIFAEKAIVYFRVPSSVKDFFIQASRSFSEVRVMREYFKNSIDIEYFIPYRHKTRAVMKTVVKTPFYGFMAIVMQILLRLVPVKKDLLNKNGMWAIAESTKEDINSGYYFGKRLNFRSYLLSTKRIILGLLYQVGGFFGANKNIISVLCYHSISGADNKFAIDAEVFEKHIEKISRHARFVSLDEIAEMLSGKKIAMPAIAITFDDGYKDIMNILPVMKKYNVPAAVFAVSDHDKINRTELGNDSDLLDYADLKRLYSEGWTIGCHSATHADFKNLSEEKIKEEIINSKKTLEEKLGFKIEYFAYPKGFFDGKIICAARSAGYKAAFSILAGCINSKSDRWILPRTIIEKNHKISEFPAVYSPTSFWVRRFTDRFNLWDRISKI